MKTWQWFALGGAAWILFRPKAAHAAGAGSGAGGISGSGTVLEVARAIPDGGVYKMTGSGVPFEITHKGKQILPKGETLYCSGFTFATAMRAAERRGLLANKSVDEVRQFQKNWYGAGGESEQLSGPALEKLGIGRSVSHDEAIPGDFVQLWRKTSGHSVVFLDWLRDPTGKKIGFKYRSAQTSNGVGDTQEKFSDSGGSVNRARTYFSRLA